MAGKCGTGGTQEHRHSTFTLKTVNGSKTKRNFLTLGVGAGIVLFMQPLGSRPCLHASVHGATAGTRLSSGDSLAGGWFRVGANGKRPAPLLLRVLARRSGGNERESSARRRSSAPNSGKGKMTEKNRRRGRPAWQRSPDDTPMRDGNRDRLIGLLTERYVDVVGTRRDSLKGCLRHEHTIWLMSCFAI